MEAASGKEFADQTMKVSVEDTGIFKRRLLNGVLTQKHGQEREVQAVGIGTRLDLGSR